VTDQGLIFGETTLFIHQLTAMIIVSIFAFSASYFLFFVVNKITPLRVSEDKEELGLDISQHGEFYKFIKTYSKENLIKKNPI
jgi:Amt family ammonium transporter